VEGKPFIAHYSFDMGVQQTYTVHVGCGGTPHHWATNNKSPWVGPSGRPVDFVCFDAHNHGGPYERCHVGFPD
jgi:hypothetical protein